MKKLSRYFLTLCSLFFLLSQADVRQQEQSLSAIALSIKEELQNLKLESAIMKADLDNTIVLLAERNLDLKLSEQERIQSQTELTGLYSSLSNMNEKYSGLLTKTLRLEERLAQEKKINFWLGLSLAVIWALKILRMILGFAWPAINKLIPLWLDILL